MRLGNVARVVAVLALGLAAAGSATSTSQNPDPMMQPPAQGQNQPPPPQQMEPTAALGLWRSTFGAVKIEADNSKGGLQTGAVQGVWVYQRQGQEVIGYFAGSLRGNVLDFRWQEPNNPPLTGAGFLVFDPQGRQYSGRWWSDRRDRVGDWNGWRQAAAQQAYTGSYGSGSSPQQYGGASYGGQTYADPNNTVAPPPPYSNQPQQPPYQPAPYNPQPYYQPQPGQPQPGPYSQPPQPGPVPPPRGYY
ncbi:MAG: hypothetical protein SFX73_37195 [Kofleriaceae bacterium]|nr:hypothetical protein [Kofleriaceae bacterium]